MKYFVNGHWYSELGRQIRMNDLLNDIRRLCGELLTPPPQATIADVLGKDCHVRIIHHRKTKGFTAVCRRRNQSTK